MKVFAYGLAALIMLLAPCATGAQALPDSAEILDSFVTSDTLGPASVEEAPPARVPALPRFRKNFLTASPLHFVGLFSLEAMFERALTPYFSLAGIGGAGPFLPAPWRVYELGGQFRGYPHGQGRHALHYGVEVFWAQVRADLGSDDDEPDLFSFHGASRFAGVGPFVGYKLTSRSGLVFELQGGYQGIRNLEDETSGGFPILNFNLGQAF